MVCGSRPNCTCTCNCTCTGEDVGTARGRVGHVDGPARGGVGLVDGLRVAAELYLHLCTWGGRRACPPRGWPRQWSVGRGRTVPAPVTVPARVTAPAPVTATVTIPGEDVGPARGGVGHVDGLRVAAELLERVLVLKVARVAVVSDAEAAEGGVRVGAPHDDVLQLVAPPVLEIHNLCAETERQREGGVSETEGGRGQRHLPGVADSTTPGRRADSTKQREGGFNDTREEGGFNETKGGWI
eukprot:1188019-Prorocentrum_minimum.AAC.1